MTIIARTQINLTCILLLLNPIPNFRIHIKLSVSNKIYSAARDTLGERSSYHRLQIFELLELTTFFKILYPMQRRKWL